jgi:hypothetical protein
MKKINLIASDISSFTGHNIYVKEEDILDKLITRNEWIALKFNKKKIDYKNNTEKKLSKLTIEEINQIKEEIKETDVNTIMQVKLTEISNIEDTNECKKELTKLFETNPSLKIIENEFKNDVRMERGIKAETKDLDNYEKETISKISERNNKTYKKKLAEIKINNEKVEIWVYGKVDGVLDESTIVETKNRMNKLFMYIPEYEKVQLETYLWLTDKKKAIHIENYNNKHNEIRYEQDINFWTECILKLIKKIETLLN